MDWAQLVSAGAIGAVLMKIVDIGAQLLLANKNKAIEHGKWLRDRQYAAFEKVAQVVATRGLFTGTTKVEEFATLIAALGLLCPDDHLMKLAAHYSLTCEKHREEYEELSREFSSSEERDIEWRVAVDKIDPAGPPLLDAMRKLLHGK